MSAPAPPLAGLRVLSVGHTLPGLYCLAALRDLGAEVIRIERIAGESDRDAGPYAGLVGVFPSHSLRAGTSACQLDLRAARGAEAFRRMASGSAALLEGFRPGVAARLGIAYEQLAPGRPALVYASLSGYGQGGPLRRRAGHDLNYLAETGALGLASPPGLPGATFADGLAGIGAALNLVAALLAAARSGRGQYLDLAIVDGPLFLLYSEFEHLWRGGASRGPGDTHLTGRYPWYAVHGTADGGRVAVGAVEPPFYAALCRRLGLGELAERQFLEGPELEGARAAVAQAFASRTREEAVALFDGADACVSPVLSIAEVERSPLAARAFAADGERAARRVRSPVRLPPPPLAPERTTGEVLRDLGFAGEEIRALVGSGAAGSG